MESWSVAHRDLQLFCADFWPSTQECQSILDEIGISSGRIDLSEPSVMRWLSILRELMRKNDGSMGRLVAVLMKQYPDNQDLRKVCAPWIATEYIQPVVAPVVPVVPATTARPNRLGQMGIDYNEEAALTRSRVESMWLAIGEIEKRLAALEKWRKSNDSP